MKEDTAKPDKHRIPAVAQINAKTVPQPSCAAGKLPGSVY